jgi:hypothetical protein
MYLFLLSALATASSAPVLQRVNLDLPAYWQPSASYQINVAKPNTTSSSSFTSSDFQQAAMDHFVNSIPEIQPEHLDVTFSYVLLYIFPLRNPIEI